MKTIGLIGGMSWESSIEYYRFINEIVRERLGGFHSAKSLMYSVDFDDIEQLQMSGNWEASGNMLAAAARSLERGGADCIVLCTNTMHKVGGHIEEAVAIPFIHIADPTAAKIKETGIETIGLLGTDFTMSQAFYRGRLETVHRLNVLVPDQSGRKAVHDIIYQELVLGEIKEESKTAYLEVIARLIERGAQGIILGCTEIGLLIKAGDCAVPVFDTTYIHAEAAVAYALAA
ncbi:MAG: aspartate/glutamate racemase family protein [Chloroflexota bacterium]